MTKGYLGIDIGSISTKGVIIDENRAIIARSYLWTEGNPTEASKNVVRELIIKHHSIYVMMTESAII